MGFWTPPLAGRKRDQPQLRSRKSDGIDLGCFVRSDGDQGALIGQPRDGDPRAAFAIADLEHQVIEFWRVPYDISVVQQRMRAAHLPEPLVQRLLLGR